MAGKKWPAAIDALNAAQRMADLWLVRFALGRAYFEHGAYHEAASEFEKCRQRRGEATALFLDDLPTFRHYATLPYWLGRAREMQKLDARPQFEEFLRSRQSAGDPRRRRPEADESLSAIIIRNLYPKNRLISNRELTNPDSP